MQQHTPWNDKNSLWGSEFPSTAAASSAHGMRRKKWNTRVDATIVTIPKKDRLKLCDNWGGAVLLQVGQYWSVSSRSSYSQVLRRSYQKLQFGNCGVVDIHILYYIPSGEECNRAAHKQFSKLSLFLCVPHWVLWCILQRAWSSYSHYMKTWKHMCSRKLMDK